MKTVAMMTMAAMLGSAAWADAKGDSQKVVAEPDLKIGVFVYNYAAVSNKILAEAEAVGTRVFREIGIELEWFDCPLSPERVADYPACQISPGPAKLAIRILSRTMAERMRQPKETFGFAQLTEDGTIPVVANVFAYDVEKLAKRKEARPGPILGDVIVHELGHLFLGVGSHSNRGIMHTPWQHRELMLIAQGLLLFTPKEAMRMRANAGERMSGGLTAMLPVQSSLGAAGKHK